MRNISFALTTPQFLDGTKDVTRRLGWYALKPGERLNAVEKLMGLKKGEKMKSLGTIEVVDVRRERLGRMIDEFDYGLLETRREGFPKWSPHKFIEFFCQSHKEERVGATADTIVTRIEFKRVAA